MSYWTKKEASNSLLRPDHVNKGLIATDEEYLTKLALAINGGPPADLLINQGVRDNVSGHTTRAPPGRVRTDNLTVTALCHNH